MNLDKFTKEEREILDKNIILLQNVVTNLNNIMYGLKFAEMRAKQLYDLPEKLEKWKDEIITEVNQISVTFTKINQESVTIYKEHIKKLNELKKT